ncbi:MAG TPA: PrsW family glutamic-type intramembrane protease [Candidatus Paceibacterota bacterium]
MAHTLTALELFLILCAGIIPPLIWLWFWLKEDSKRPEPRNLLILSFFCGALAVIFVLPLQALSNKLLSPGLVLLLAWATIEELAKLGVAFAVDFRKRTYDEPVDSMIYLVTVALGFAAFENVLFLFKSMSESGVNISIITASMRFIGATLLHVFSSAILGGFMALGYCKSRRQKFVYLLAGILVASALHTLFNFFIMNEVIIEGTGNILAVFAMLWVGIILLLVFFEKVKTITCQINTVNLNKG